MSSFTLIMISSVTIKILVWFQLLAGAIQLVLSIVSSSLSCQAVCCRPSLGPQQDLGQRAQVIYTRDTNQLHHLLQNGNNVDSIEAGNKDNFMYKKLEN